MFCVQILAVQTDRSLSVHVGLIMVDEFKQRVQTTLKHAHGFSAVLNGLEAIIKEPLQV